MSRFCHYGCCSYTYKTPWLLFPLLFFLVFAALYCRLRVFRGFRCFIANHVVGPLSTHRSLTPFGAHSQRLPIRRNGDGVCSLAHSYALVYKYPNLNSFLGFVTRYSFVLCIVSAVCCLLLHFWELLLVTVSIANENIRSMQSQLNGIAPAWCCN